MRNQALSLVRRGAEGKPRRSCRGEGNAEVVCLALC